MFRKTLALFLLVLANSTANALSGDLDTSFSSDGLVLTDFGSLDNYSAIARDASGRIVVAGTTDRSGSQWILARYTVTGALDTSFGIGGGVQFDAGANNDAATGVAIQADGKIVVAGLSGGRAIVARFTSTGSLDTGFGPSGNGKAVAFSSSGSGGVSVGIDSSGRIVVAGTTSVGTDQEFIVARFTSAGVLDNAFSGDGLSTTGFGPGSADTATGMAVVADGNIVVVGNAGAISSGTGPDLALASFSATTGSVLSGTRFNGFNCSDSAAAVAVQPDGKIVVAGLVQSLCTNTQSIVRPVVVRFSASATLDTTFNGTGSRNIAFSSLDSGIPKAIAVQPDGRIVVAGLVKSTNQTHRTEFGLTRLNATGSADLSFSGDAMQQASFGAGEAGAATMLLQASDGRIVAAGTFSTFNASGALVNRDGAVARFHAIACNNANATRVGTSGNDTIAGTAGADVIHGASGNDTIDGTDGSDTICGGDGNDQLVGGTGDDTLFGESGLDGMNGSSGNDTCFSGFRSPGIPDADTFLSCETINSGLSGLSGDWLRLEQHCSQPAGDAGQQCLLTGTLSVFNPGQESTAVPAQVSFFLSADGVLDESDHFLTAAKVRAVLPGEAQPLPFVHRLPGATDLLGHYVIAFVDSTDVIPERNEDNNYAAGLISGGH